MDMIKNFFLKRKWAKFLRKQKSDYKPHHSLIHVIVDGTVQLIHKETHAIFESLRLTPTPEDPQMGVCNDCFKSGFINQLMNFEEDSCFMKGHDIDPVAGIPWKQTPQYKEQYADELFYENLEGTRFEMEVPK